MQKMHEVPRNFRRLLSSKLRRLVAQNKIEKVNTIFQPDSDGTFLKEQDLTMGLVYICDVLS